MSALEPTREGECDDVYVHLFEYLDSEMTPDDEVRVREHLKTCSPCLAELSIEELIRQLLKRTCVERAPEHLRDRVVAQVRTYQVGSEN